MAVYNTLTDLLWTMYYLGAISFHLGTLLFDPMLIVLAVFVVVTGDFRLLTPPSPIKIWIIASLFGISVLRWL